MTPVMRLLLVLIAAAVDVSGRSEPSRRDLNIMNITRAVALVDIVLGVAADYFCGVFLTLAQGPLEGRAVYSSDKK